MVKRNRVAADEIVYWEPAASNGQASFSSPPEQEKEEKVEAIYYTPPQTPQEAIEMGLVGWRAVKPKNWLHHWERLGVTHKPKNWFCWWGCEGVQGVMDAVQEPTHDYYCPFWEMLLLFPEWEEDFTKGLLDRPPMPEGGPPLKEEEYNAKKRRYSEAIARRNKEAESNPYNLDAEQLQLESRRTRIRVKRSEKDSGKELARNGIRTTPFSKEYHESRTESDDNEWSFDVPKSKQKRPRKNS